MTLHPSAQTIGRGALDLWPIQFRRFNMQGFLIVELGGAGQDDLDLDQLWFPRNQIDLPVVAIDDTMLIHRNRGVVFVTCVSFRCGKANGMRVAHKDETATLEILALGCALTLLHTLGLRASGHGVALRSCSNHGARALVLTAATPVPVALVKRRSIVASLRRRLRHIAALGLGGNLLLRSLYVPTDDNSADYLSRSEPISQLLALRVAWSLHVSSASLVVSFS